MLFVCNSCKATLWASEELFISNIGHHISLHENRRISSSSTWQYGHQRWRMEPDTICMAHSITLWVYCCIQYYLYIIVRTSKPRSWIYLMAVVITARVQTLAAPSETRDSRSPHQENLPKTVAACSDCRSLRVRHLIAEQLHPSAKPLQSATGYADVGRSVVVVFSDTQTMRLLHRGSAVAP